MYVICTRTWLEDHQCGQKIMPRRYAQEHGIMPQIKLQEYVVVALLQGGQQRDSVVIS